jgi:hypothetical protein
LAVNPEITRIPDIKNERYGFELIKLGFILIAMLTFAVMAIAFISSMLGKPIDPISLAVAGTAISSFFAFLAGRAVKN